MRRGLVVTTLSFGGLVGGAYAGSRVAPHLLRGGSGSAWTPIAGLIGAMLGAVLLQALAGTAGAMVRGGLWITPLRLLDSFGGLFVGAAGDVVRVLGTACGLGIEGTGCYVADNLVVTAAHVVAGEHDTGVEIPGLSSVHAADVVVFDSHNDIAILRVQERASFALPLVDPHPGAEVAVVGYPEDGPLQSAPGRIGGTAVALT